MKTQSGVTLIELLVVIAIIGILAGILFVAIDPSAQTKKANRADIQASLSGVPSAALIKYDNDNFSYANVCNATTGAVSAEIQGLSGYTCNASATAYAAWATVPDTGDGNTVFCVDSTGTRTLLSAAPAATATACN